MKKVGLWLSTLFALVLCVGCLVACGSGTNEEEENPKVGTYKFVSCSMEIAGQMGTLQIGDTFGDFVFTEDYMILELKKDGTAVFVSEGRTMNGSWAEEESNETQIKLTIEGETQTIDCEGDTLKINDTGLLVTLKKK